MTEEDWDFLFWSLGYTVHAAKRLEHQDRDKIERKARELVGKLAWLRTDDGIRIWNQEANGMNDKPCSVERTSRQVIERKLLDSLSDENKVAILATRQDLEDMLAALSDYAFGERSDDVLSSAEREAQQRRCTDLANGLRQLLREAFPK